MKAINKKDAGTCYNLDEWAHLPYKDDEVAQASDELARLATKLSVVAAHFKR